MTVKTIKAKAAVCLMTVMCICSQEITDIMTHKVGYGENESYPVGNAQYIRSNSQLASK